MEKKYRFPSIAWLKVTNFMHGWLQHELGSSISVCEQKVVCLQDLPGIGEAMRMETVEDVTSADKVSDAMSPAMRNCISAGITLDESAVQRIYGMTKDAMKSFIPIEMPSRCLTRDGVLRPWTKSVCPGKRQAFALQRIIRDAFWRGVEDHDRKYAMSRAGKKYHPINMIEDFCAKTGTPDMYAEAMRREWQRRVSRRKVK